jgi:hypothetical protein
MFPLLKRVLGPGAVFMRSIVVVSYSLSELMVDPTSHPSHVAVRRWPTDLSTEALRRSKLRDGGWPGTADATGIAGKGELAAFRRRATWLPY